MNPLLAIINYHKSQPAIRHIENPLDNDYCYLSSEDVQKFAPAFKRHIEALGLDKYQEDGNDCDDSAYECVSFFKRLHSRDSATTLICVAVGETHVVALVFHSATEWTHYNTQGGILAATQIDDIYRLERV